MEALQNLLALSDEIRNTIEQQFGSIGNLYKIVFDLHNEDYQLHTTKPKDYQARQNEIKSKLFAIEEQLDKLGVDGHSIITDISSDQTEIIVNKHIQNLDNYLRQFGTDFETMRNWMKETHGI